MVSERIRKIIDDLQGTCQSLDDACSTQNICFNDLTIEELEVLDSEIFKCETCGWWYEISEESEETGKCDNCFEEENDIEH